MNRTAPPPLPEHQCRPPRPLCEMSFTGICREIEEKCHAKEAGRHGIGKHHVVFTPQAYREFCDIVGYGRWTPLNCYEQQYAGLGYYFASEGEITVVVTHVLYIYSDVRKRASVRVMSDSPMWDCIDSERKMYKAFEEKYNEDPDGCLINPFVSHNEDLMLVLNGHTHPGIGGTFFSEPDRISNRASSDAPRATFVCDPINREMKAKVGTGWEDAQIVIFTKDEGPGQEKTGKTEAPELDAMRTGTEADAQKKENAAASDCGQSISSALNAELAASASRLLSAKGVRGSVRMRSIFGCRITKMRIIEKEKK